MAPDEIKILLESYYSGDISPDDYETLLSEMKEAKDLPPELEYERRILLSVDSYEPTMPEGFEKMLSAAIDKRYRQTHNALSILISAAAAAIVLICITVGIFKFSNNGLSDPEHIAGSCVPQKEAPGYALQPTGPAEEIEATAEFGGMKSADKRSSSELKEESAIAETDDEELDKAGRIVDESLLSVLSMIHLAQNEVAESLENIQTNQRTDNEN